MTGLRGYMTAESNLGKKNNKSNYQKKLEEYNTRLNVEIRKRKQRQPSYNSSTTNEKKKLDLIKNRLQVLSSKGWFNKFYKGQKKILENNPQSINTVLQDLTTRRNRYNPNLGNTGKEGRQKARKEFLEETIKLLLNQKQQPIHTAGSKKRRRRQKVKGKRVLKNGTLAGYVKQADGSWRWRFLPK